MKALDVERAIGEIWYVKSPMKIVRREYTRQEAEDRLTYRLPIQMGAVLLPLYRTYSGEAIPGFASAAQLSEGIEDAALCSHFEQAASATLPKEQAVSPRRASAEEYGGLMSRSQIAMWTRHKGLVSCKPLHGAL